jgi:hypothetical protein
LMLATGSPAICRELPPLSLRLPVSCIFLYLSDTTAQGGRYVDTGLGECSAEPRQCSIACLEPCLYWGMRTNVERTVTAAVSSRSIPPPSIRPMSQTVQSGTAGGEACMRKEWFLTPPRMRAYHMNASWSRLRAHVLRTADGDF